MIVKLLGGES